MPQPIRAGTWALRWSQIQNDFGFQVSTASCVPLLPRSSLLRRAGGTLQGRSVRTPNPPAVGGVWPGQRGLCLCLTLGIITWSIFCFRFGRGSVVVGELASVVPKAVK